MSKEQKASMYYFLMRGYHGQLLSLCDSIIAKKGKDPISLFWKAYALGASGNINDALRQLDNFQARKDLSYPVTMAMLYFHQRAQVVDHEAVDMLTAELSAAEDVAKEPGYVLAARFALYTHEYSTARSITEKLLGSNASAPSSVFEQDAQAVSYWCDVLEYADRYHDVSSAYTQSLKKRLISFDSIIRNRMDQVDVDLLMAYIKAKQLLESHADALNALNQVIAMHAWFTYALAEKAMMLASMRDWDQALDTAQRSLDADRDNIDAMHIIAIHAFTQESHPDDATQKLLDVDKAILAREPYNAALTMRVMKLYSIICMRQPRVLDICVRALERAHKHVDTMEVEAQLLCMIGDVRILQGSSQYMNASKAYKEAIKRDGDNLHALEGMVRCQLLDQQYDDAEAQMELLLVMHSIEEMGAEYHYDQACLAKAIRHDMKEHLSSLERCKSTLLQHVADNSRIYYHPFMELQSINPDFMMMLAVEYLQQVQAAAFIPFNNTPVISDDNAASTSSQANTSSGQTMLQVNNGSTLAMTMMNLNTVRGSAGATLTLTHTSKPSKRSAVDDDDFNSTSNYNNEASSPALLSCIMIISKLLKICPGHVCVYVELARCLMMQGNYEDASRCLRQYLVIQPTSCPALLALAKLDLHRQHTASANRSLEQALAADFSIRSSILFQLLQVYVQAQQSKYDEAIVEMEKIMQAPEIRGDHHQTSTDSLGLPVNTLSSNPIDPLRLMPEDRVGAYISYSYLLSKTKRWKEAKRILTEAKVLFAGTEQEIQIIIASSQLSIERKDYDSAIRMLDQIAYDSLAYTRAQMMKADILLSYHHDKEGYITCYQQLVSNDDCAKNHAALGDAYLRILQPELAVDALETAYRLDPIIHHRLRTRIGRALIATHEYHRAIDFYESNIKELLKSSSTSSSSQVVSLSHDLAKLYRKLERYESSTRVLMQIMHPDSRDVAELHHDVTSLLLLSELQASSSPITTSTTVSSSSEYISTLIHAKDIQRDIINMLRATSSTASETITEEKEILSDICERLGLAYAAIGDNPTSASMYNEAITHDASNTGAMLGQAKIYRHKGDLDACQAECQKVLHIEASNSEAAIMLSELLFLSSSMISNQSAAPTPSAAKQDDKNVTRGFDDIPDIADINKPITSASLSTGWKNANNDFSLAVKPLQDLLSSQPNNYHVLEKMISLLRRAGRLSEVSSYIDAALSYDRRSSEHAGYHYCVGLYKRYMNDVGHAIAEFNYARHDDRWGYAALTHMIELYLNPDQESIWEQERGNNKDSDHRGGHNTSDHDDEQIVQNLRAAETLLKELESKSKNPLKFRVLECYYYLATKQKSNISRALNGFKAIYDNDPDYLPGVLGLATAYMMEYDEHKAHNILKRVAKMDMNEDDGEDFDRANLLLARSYVDKSKYSLAQDICQRCLGHNRSSAQAWEILGLIYEKTSDYMHAGECYEKAWQLEYELSAAIGFKLAFSYLKSGRYVECVDVCETVLMQYPDYPRIRDEILKKAHQDIRTQSK